MKKGQYKWLAVSLVLLLCIGCSLYIGYQMGAKNTSTAYVSSNSTPSDENNKDNLPEGSVVAIKKPLEQSNKNGDSRNLNSMALSYDNKVYVPLDIVSQLVSEYAEVSYQESTKCIAVTTTLWKPFIVKPQLLGDDMPLADVEKMLGKPLSSKKQFWEDRGADILINKYRDAEITYVKTDGVYKVYIYTITTDRIMTDREIKVGSTADEVRKAYGQEVPLEWRDLPDDLEYGIKERIIFHCKDDRVSSITVSRLY